METELDRLLSDTPDFTRLLSLYVYQVERLHGMAYHTAISLRHRLISSLHKLDEIESSILESRIRYEKLASQYSSLEAQLSELLESRAVRLNLFINKMFKHLRIN